jgi:ribonuclease HI
MAELTRVQIYTDGACSGNPGPGGWGAILKSGGHVKELSGGEASTTNNRMELSAVIAALEALKRPCAVTLTSDSKYVIDAIQKGWAKSWRAKGWMRNKNEKAKNPDLWERLLQLLEIHQVEFIWVKGHAGHPENERCDELAVMESKKF